MKIGILQAGHSPPELTEKFGDYDEFFKRLLAGNDFEFSSYPVVDGVFPAHIDDADGWLISGSKFSVYEDHEWIAPLEDFLREAFAGGKPMVGICFGHQILAQALGGKVEKFDAGWSVGVESYQLDGYSEDVTLLAWHQDQVIEPPTQARVVGSSAFCPYAALAYGDQAYTIQPHPEFEVDFVAELIEARREILPPDIAAKGINSLARKTLSADVGAHIAAFFLKQAGINHHQIGE